MRWAMRTIRRSDIDQAAGEHAACCNRAAQQRMRRARAAIRNRTIHGLGGLAASSVGSVAPAINLSGEQNVDPLLQADILFGQAQTIRGVAMIPVNRVAQVYAALKLEKVESADQAAIVCDLLGCDALIVPTVTSFDPYSPPKFGCSLELFGKPRNFAVPKNIDPRDLVREATPPVASGMSDAQQAMQRSGAFVQAVGMFDAANGTVRQAVLDYAVGRNDPEGPLGSKEYFMNMDRYCGFAYHALLGDLVNKLSPAPARPSE